MAKLDALAKTHGLSTADVIEALVDQEYAEQRRLKGKAARYQRNKHAKKA